MKNGQQGLLKQYGEMAWLGGLALAGLVYRLAALAIYPATGDELGSYRVMRSIAETGVPWIFDGLLYWRSLLAHYLMAIPLLFVSEGLVGMRLVTVAAGALCLVATWMVARQVGGRIVAALAVLLSAVLLGGTLWLGQLTPAASRWQLFGHQEKYADPRAAHDFLRQSSRPGESIISMEPLVTEFYLGRPVDFLLRQRYNPDQRRLETFPPEESRYLGGKVIDSVDKLLEVSRQPGTVWVVVNSRGVTIDDAMKYMLNRNFQVAHVSLGGSVLVRRTSVAQPPSPGSER